MAKVHLDRLKKKYKNVPVTGDTYGALINEIITENTDAINKGLARKTSSQLEKVNKKITSKEKRLVLPSEDEVIPKRALHVLKSAEKGALIKDSLRDKLTQKLRQSMFDSDTPYLKKRGETAGRINPKLVNEFKGNITDVFQNYTKRDKKFGMPSNVHNIAVTEVRSAINITKKEYANRLLENNPHIKLRKKWIHNSSLSKEPRRAHKKMDGKTINFDQYFNVPVMLKQGKRWIKTDTTPMSHPHDPGAPPEQVIGCNCDYDIMVKL